MTMGTETTRVCAWWGGVAIPLVREDELPNYHPDRTKTGFILCTVKLFLPGLKSEV